MTAQDRKHALLVAIVLFLPILNGCGGGSEDWATIRPGPVSEFRRVAIERAHAVDNGIAALEEKRLMADSLTGAAYQRTINELLDARRLFEEGLGSLDTLTTDQFDVVVDSLLRQLALLERVVNNAEIELAPNLQTLKNVARGRFSAFADEIEELRVGSDSTLDVKLTVLARRSEAISDSIDAASAENLDVLRQTIVADLRLIRASLDSLRFEHAVRGISTDSTAVN